MALIKCPECGKDVSDQAEKCPNCGHPINGTAVHPAVSDKENHASQGNRKKVLIGLVVAVVVVIVAVVAYFVATADSRAYAQAQELYTAGDYQGALEMFTELGDYEDSSAMAEQCEYELTVDRRFIRDFSASLVARWADSDASGVIGEDPEYFEKWSQMEIDALTPYVDQQFNDPHLQELLNEYLGYLNSAVESTMYYSTQYSMFSEKWQDAYNGRATVIKELVDDYELTVPEQYQSYLDDFIDAANVAAAEQAVHDASQAIADAMEIETVVSEFGYESYKGTLVNTSEYTYDYFSVNIQAIDSDGTIVGSGNCTQISNWEPNEKASVDVYIIGVDSIEGLTLEFTPTYRTCSYFE